MNKYIRLLQTNIFSFLIQYKSIRSILKGDYFYVFNYNFQKSYWITSKQRRLYLDTISGNCLDEYYSYIMIIKRESYD